MSYGVPNPYVVTTHPYPTRYHGGIWTRPTFGMPTMRSVQSVFKNTDFNDGNPGLRGLGTDVNVGNGVFGTARAGGGVFGPSLYGLGGQGDDIDAIASMILSTPTRSTAAFDVQAEFRSWYGSLGPFDKSFSDDAFAKAASYRERFNAANVSGSLSTAQPAPAGSATQAVTEGATKAIQQTLSAALVNAGYQSITADGKIGPGTCGAIAWYQKTVNPAAGAQFAAACAAKQPWTAPTKKSAGGGGYTPPAAPVPVEPLQAGLMGGDSGTLAMIAGGALAIGLAVIGKKKGWF